MTTSTAVNLHLNPAEIGHRWNPAGKFGTLLFGDSLNGVTVFIHTPAEVDKVIAELVALKQEMAPPVLDDGEAEACGFRYLDADGTARSCQRHPGGESHETHWQYDDDCSVVHESGFPATPAPEPEPYAEAIRQAVSE